MLKRRPLLPRMLIQENVPKDGAWTLRCECGATLAFAYRDRGTPATTLLVTHDGFPARFHLAARSTEGLLWSIGLADPLGDWIERVHEYLDDDGADECAVAGEPPA